MLYFTNYLGLFVLELYQLGFSPHLFFSNMTRLMDKARFIALAVKKADADCEEAHLSLSTVSKSHRHCMDKLYQVFMQLLKAHNELSSLFCPSF